MKKRKDIFKYKSYAHFDNRKAIEKVKEYIYNTKKIKEHSFLPFILDIHKMEKFDKEKYLKNLKENVEKKEKVRKEKKRNIMFSSHLDRYIYQLYNYKLNNSYNDYVKKNGINKCSIAYRNNLKGKNNISFAHDVFKFIINKKNSYILVGDFKDFFEGIDHKYLKKMICKVLNKSNLDEDYYAVFKNITKYTYFDLEDICKIKGIKRKDVYKHTEKINSETGKKEYVFELEKIMTIEEINKYKTRYLHYNNKSGIPQGSAISSVLANIYMIDADKMINDLVTSNKGLYRRYSDDFIVIIPNITKEKFEIIFNSIKEILNQNGNPVLKDEKTRVYYYEEEKLKNINMDFLPKIANTKNELEYLGFCFTGDKIKIRDKTMSKFYYRMYKKIKTIALSHGKTKSGKNISGEKLYKLYSKYGKDDKKGNFITYNERCEKEFKDLDKYFISYKNRFIMKLKNRYNKEMQKYKDIDTKRYYGILKKKKNSNKK